MTSEAGRVLSVLVAMVIFSLSQAAEIKSSERVIVTPTPNIAVVLTQLVTGFLLLLAATYIIFTLISPILGGRSLSSYTTRLGVEDMGLLGRVLNSIDPVESAFAIMNVDEVACRERTVCELHGAAARMPLVGALLRYMSPFIRGLDNYKEARDAGEALEDCALLFAECPYSMIQ